MNSVLLVESDPGSISLVQLVLAEFKSYKLEIAGSYADALARIAELQPAVILLAHGASGVAGPQAIADIRKSDSSVPVIALLPLDKGLRQAYQNAGAAAFVRKDHTYYASLRKVLNEYLQQSSGTDSGSGGENALLSMMSAFQAGDEVLHFRIIAPIAEGGMGEIYKAEDTKLGRTVVLKVLPLASVKDELAKQRLLREARAASAFNHPNIVTVFSVEQAGDLHFIVMEFLEGRSLSDMTASGPIPITDLLDIISSIADALEAAHKTGLMHRDIKPSNILVTAAGQSKLLDFGLAKSSRDPRIATVTASGLVLGTVNYMSPEQVQGKELDSRTDIFSLGCVLYEAATGVMPFSDSNIALIFRKIVHVDPQPPGSLQITLPFEFDQITAKALAKDRDQRYQTAGEMAGALRHLRQAMTAKFRVRPDLVGNAEGRNLYLKGHHSLKKLTEEHLLKARDYFEQSIMEDPSAAPSFVGLAQAYNLLSFYGYVSGADAFPKAKIAVNKAIAGAGAHAESHAVLGLALLLGWDFDGAEKAFQQALNLSTESTAGHLWYCFQQLVLGNTDVAGQYIDNALETDPLSLQINTLRGTYFYLCRQYDRSIKQLQTVLEMEPDYKSAHFYLGLSYQQSKKYDEALQEFQRGIASNADTRCAAGMACCAAEMQQTEKAGKILEGLRKMSVQRYVPPAELGLVCAAMNDYKQAFDCLDKACEDKSSWMLFLNCDPRFDTMREDTRFQAIQNLVHQGSRPGPGAAG